MKIARLMVVIMISAPIVVNSMDQLVRTGAKAVAGAASHLLMKHPMHAQQQRFFSVGSFLVKKQEEMDKVKKELAELHVKNPLEPRFVPIAVSAGLGIAGVHSVLDLVLDGHVDLGEMLGNSCIGMGGYVMGSMMYDIVLCCRKIDKECALERQRDRLQAEIDELREEEAPTTEQDKS